MKTLRNTFMLLAIFSAAQGLHAQTEEDVTRYGQTFTGGTGRYLGMGGAFNALGGDMSSLSSNPAGSAVFLSNELSFSLGMNTYSANTSYMSMRADELTARPVIPSLGLNGYFAMKDPNSKWKAINIAYAYTRIKDFYNSTTYRGNGAGSSMAETWANRATGVDTLDLYNGTGYAFDDLGASLAYNNYLIERDTNYAGFYYYTPFQVGNSQQVYKMVSQGRMGDNTFVLGANYNNKLYIGGGFTITGITYDYREVDTETDLTPGAYITDFTYRYNISVRGTGYNAKVGMIYRVADMLRFGLSIQTPTTFRMNEVYFAGLTTNFTGYPKSDIISSDLPTNEGADFASNYNIVTPMKLGFGVAWLFGKKGLISVDYNRQDLGDSRFRNQTSGYDNYNIDFSIANDQLANYLGTINQLKVGAEAKLGKVTLRGGYGYQDNAFKVQNRSRATDIKSVSGGVGFNFGNASLDFGLTNAKYTSDFTLYSDAGRDAEAGTVRARASSSNSITSAALTLILRY